MRSDRDGSGRNSTLLSGLLVASLLLMAFAVLTLGAIGPLERLDIALNGRRNLAPFRDELMAIDRIGQRAVCLPLLAIATGLAAWRTRRLRPVTVAAVSVVALNLGVLVLKLSLSRGLPRLEDPSFFLGGDIYPSGHAANVVLVYGLIAYLLLRYGVVSRRARGRLTAAVVVLSLIMLATSLALRWHWFTDLVGGFLIGAAVLCTTVAVDRYIPWRPATPAQPDRSAKSPVVASKQW